MALSASALAAFSFLFNALTTLATVGLLATTIVYTVCTVRILRDAGKHFRHERTASYIERYCSAEFTKLRAEIDQFLYLTEKLTPSERGVVYKELLFSDHLDDLEFRHKLWTFTMLFNEIGLAWHSGVIDTNVVTNFDRLIPRYWMRLRPYIMNLHIRFRFEVPIDGEGFKGEFKLFKMFRHAYIKLLEEKLAIEPVDLITSELLCRENFAALDRAMVYHRPETPQRISPDGGESVINSIRTKGSL